MNICKVLRNLEDGLLYIEELKACNGPLLFNSKEGTQPRYSDALKSKKSGTRISISGASPSKKMGPHTLATAHGKVPDSVILESPGDGLDGWEFPSSLLFAI